jgi:hypothetical protein
MLKARGVQRRFWGEDVNTMFCTLNRSYMCNVDNKTPHVVWHGKIPSLHYLSVFGCVALVKMAHSQIMKLDE